MRDDIAEAMVNAITEGYTRLSEKLENLTRVLERTKMVDQAVIDRLKAAIERNSSVQDSVVSLVNGQASMIRTLSEQIKQQGQSTDPAEIARQLSELADALEKDTQEYADAVAANTPAEQG